MNSLSRVGSADSPFIVITDPAATGGGDQDSDDSAQESVKEHHLPWSGGRF